MTKPKRYKRYSSEFKREAIRRSSEEGVTDAAVCAELGISTRQFRISLKLRQWRNFGVNGLYNKRRGKV